MKIITNENDKQHLETLKELISKSKKIQIAVSFLKKSGLNLVKNDLEKALKKGAEIEIVCGRDFYLTEPEALYELLKIFKKNNNAKLYLYEGNSNTFHPKLYFFINGNTAYILVGSANFTSGGFQNNIEISTLETTKVGDALYKKINSFFKMVKKDAIEARKSDIEKYQQKYNIFHKKIKEAESEAKEEIKTKYSTDQFQRIDPVELFKKGIIKENDKFYFVDDKGEVHKEIKCRVVLNKRGPSHSFIITIEKIKRFSDSDIYLAIKWVKKHHGYKLEMGSIENTTKGCSIFLHKLFKIYGNKKKMPYLRIGDKNFVRESDGKSLFEIREEQRS